MRSTHDIIKSLIVGYALVEICLTWGQAVRLARFAAELGEKGDSLNYVSPLRVWGIHLLLFLVAAVLVKISKPWALVSAAFIGSWLALVSAYDIFEFFRFFLVTKNEMQFGWLAYRRWLLFDPGGIQVFPRFICQFTVSFFAICGLRALKKKQLRTST